MHRNGFREVYSDETQLLPELPLVGRARLAHARVPGLPAHRHADALEIFYIERGRVEWWVEKETYVLPAGWVYLNRPGELHGSLGAGLQPCGYLWLNLVVPKAGLPGMPRRQSRGLQKAIATFRRRTFPGSDALKSCFLHLVACHRTRTSHAEIEARAHLHLLLVHLLRDYQRAGQSQPPVAGPSFAIRKVLKTIEQDLSRIHSVEELAAVARLGATRFADRFFQEVGFTPAAYLRRRRIERAKLLLREGKKSLTEIAFEVGFSSSQHFATAFKQVEGVPPSGFRNSTGAPRSEKT